MIYILIWIFRTVQLGKSVTEGGEYEIRLNKKKKTRSVIVNARVLIFFSFEFIIAMKMHSLMKKFKFWYFLFTFVLNVKLMSSTQQYQRFNNPWIEFANLLIKNKQEKMQYLIHHKLRRIIDGSCLCILWRNPQAHALIWPKWPKHLIAINKSFVLFHGIRNPRLSLWMVGMSIDFCFAERKIIVGCNALCGTKCK